MIQNNNLDNAVEQRRDEIRAGNSPLVFGLGIVMIFVGINTIEEKPVLGTTLAAAGIFAMLQAVMEYLAFHGNKSAKHVRNGIRRYTQFHINHLPTPISDTYNSQLSAYLEELRGEVRNNLLKEAEFNHQQRFDDKISELDDEQKVKLSNQVKEFFCPISRCIIEDALLKMQYILMVTCAKFYLNASIWKQL